MAGWSEAPMDRHQVALFSPTLDSMIGEDHPVRLFDELLSLCDWSAWENHYVQVHGQPPIHPRIIAGVILYGLSRGIRSSRALEYMLASNVDFMWLSSGRRIDHSTICGFRTRFGRELKALFRDVFRIALRAGLARLECVALDATRVKANSSRHRTTTSETLEQRLSALDEQIDRMIQESEEADAQETDLFGQATPNRLPKELADLKRRQARLRKAMAAAKSKDTSASSEPKAKTKRPRVAVADPDSTVQPNKEGGYAPNYTPMATTEDEGGFIAVPEVLAGAEEAHQATATIDRIEEDFGQRPQRLLADSSYDRGQTLADLASREVEAFIPLQQRPTGPDNPARRDDPAEPVKEEDWAQLPRNARTKRLDRSAFVYDEQADCYYCPMGRTLRFRQMGSKLRRTGTVRYRMYQCDRCVGCPLYEQCVSSKTGKRTVTRDEHEVHREAMDRRLGSAHGREVYRHRRWIAETPFAVLKERMGLRQFLLRGLGKVKIEWLWACTAFNLAKLVGKVAAAPSALPAAQS